MRATLITERTAADIAEEALRQVDTLARAPLPSETVSDLRANIRRLQALADPERINTQRDYINGGALEPL